MQWFDEVRLSRHPIAEIGVAFYIRTMMKNAWTPSIDDLREVFGPEWERHLEGLRRAGMLRMTRNNRSVSLKIVAPGDKRRDDVRRMVKRRRDALKSGK